MLNVSKFYNYNMRYTGSVSRMQVLMRILGSQKIDSTSSSWFKTVPVRFVSEDGKKISIGDVSKKLKNPRNPELVPTGYLLPEPSQSWLKNLQWLLQKDLLGQDVFLIGSPGPLRRSLALAYLEMTQREVEFVTLTRDTTDTDLKQRREIRHGTSFYHDQSAVRAAVEGRILILEGIEKVERNVLPVLNNLLENREMQLEDGRLLIPSQRYDRLLKEHSQEEMDNLHLVRVSEDFRVIALGIPCPPYQGHPLDPPLRSRFQARDVSNTLFKDHLEELLTNNPNVKSDVVTKLLSLSHTLLSEESKALSLPDFPVANLDRIVAILNKFPSAKLEKLISRLYPYSIFLPHEGVKTVDDVFATFELPVKQNSETIPHINEVKEVKQDGSYASVTMKVENLTSSTNVLRGSSWGNTVLPFFSTPYHEELLVDLLQSHSVGDFCVIGPRGSGKSMIVNKFAHMLGYQTEPILLYQDMTSRDLVQQRVTSLEGDTSWQFSPLVIAALEGKLAILDGIHRLHHGTLAVLHRLLHDREMQLYDGSRLMRHDRYDDIKAKNGFTEAEMAASSLFRIDPSFRIVALAEPPVVGAAQGQWLSPEALTLFMFHSMRPLNNQEMMQLITHLVGDCSPSMERLITLSWNLDSSSDSTLRSLAQSLSLRQLIRIARRLHTYPDFDLHSAVYKACLARFLPPIAKQALDDTLDNAAITRPEVTSLNQPLNCSVQGNILTIGKTQAPIYHPDSTTKIPETLFFNIHQHVSVLENMLQDWLLGDHLLLVGNQGVGKNKLADRFLYLLNRPREYIQLHRDTTVQSLTLQPTVRDGQILYEDSPLVKAVMSGYVLLVDEADKAPTHVTCVLKTLVESGEMLLSDGRRIVPPWHPMAKSEGSKIIVAHPDFRMIVLANRPGFPFLGNDFFASLGDLFSCHTIDNPSVESELTLLRSYGPDVSDEIIRKLVSAFSELRDMADQGVIQYPYSTREVVNIIKHLQEFPSEGVASVIRNVFDFDSWSGETKETLIQVLHRHGIPVGVSPNSVKFAKKLALPEANCIGSWRIMRHSTEGGNAVAQLAVDSQPLRLKGLPRQAVFKHQLDMAEARTSVFSEQQSYWQLPIPETSVVMDVVVQSGRTQDALDDTVNVLTAAPACVYSFVPRTNHTSKSLREIMLQDIFPQKWATKHPRVHMASLPDGRLAVFDEVSGIMVFVSANDGSVQALQTGSVFGDARASIMRRLDFGNKEETFLRMSKEDAGKGQLALWEVDGGNVTLLDFVANQSHSFTLDMSLNSFHALGDQKWMAVDEKGGKWLLKLNLPNENLSVSSVSESTHDQTTELLSLTSVVPDDIGNFVLTTALKQQISAPSRLLIPTENLAAIAVGFPDLDSSENELYMWNRNGMKIPKLPNTCDPASTIAVLEDAGQILRVVSHAPSEAFEGETAPAFAGCFLEVVDLINHSLSYIPVPRAPQSSPHFMWSKASTPGPLAIASTSGQGVVSVDSAGVTRLWQTGTEGLSRSLAQWRQMIGADTGNRLRMEIEQETVGDVSSPKHGKEDPTGAPHQGGNTWAGGTGGRDTAGLGGMGGPYRLDAGHDVNQVPEMDKNAVPEEVKEAARKMARKAFADRLRQIKMSEYDAGLYERLRANVAPQIKSMRSILSSLQAKGKERQWWRHRTSGELDDTKLIEGLAGERNIYRQRREEEPEVGAPQIKPKRMRLLVDVSGSMYRFNGFDGRLEREMEATLLVMEAFEGFENKFQYEIFGHSGDEAAAEMVKFDRPPKNNKERLDVIKTMHAHSQFCISGDNTLEAAKHAIKALSSIESDESFVILLSDANLERYGIKPKQLANIMTSEPSVNTFAIFIGSLGDQAHRLNKALPAGRSFICLDLKDLPHILQKIYTSTLLTNKSI